MRSISAIAEELGLPIDHVHGWGPFRAKIDLEAARAPQGRLVLVSAITPTVAGEGKTTMSISLAMGLRKRGRKALAVLREPSLGPVFGMKGGGTGGGKATLEPAADINLHFTGDLHAITAAHNLLAALVDNALHWRQPVEMDPRTVTWPRVMDMNDRSLRKVVLGLGGKTEGVPREGRFDITAASEVMALLCLSRDRADLEARCARIVVGDRYDGTPVTAGDLGAAGAMAALLKDAIMPNLVQTAEGGPALVHGGPFGNIAHGCNSIVATKMGLGYADEVVTEAGFGFDLGGEKFLDIKCRTGGIWPRIVVLVATVRALRVHGGANPKQANVPDAAALRRGLAHLDRHLDAIGSYGLNAVVCVNRFPDDTTDELEALRAHCAARGTRVAACEGFARGGDGSLAIADEVLAALDETPVAEPKHPYALEAPIPEKIRAVARQVYGADDVAFTPGALNQIARVAKNGGALLPVVMAKTHLSLTDDPTKQGSPRGFTVTVREVRLYAGAGYVVALTGEIMTMPGLPKVPAAAKVRTLPDGRIVGLMQED